MSIGICQPSLISSSYNCLQALLIVVLCVSGSQSFPCYVNTAVLPWLPKPKEHSIQPEFQEHCVLPFWRKPVVTSGGATRGHFSNVLPLWNQEKELGLLTGGTGLEGDWALIVTGTTGWVRLQAKRQKDSSGWGAGHVTHRRPRLVLFKINMNATDPHPSAAQKPEMKWAYAMRVRLGSAGPDRVGIAVETVRREGASCWGLIAIKSTFLTAYQNKGRGGGGEPGIPPPGP